MLKAMGEIVLRFDLVLTPLRFTWSFAPGQRPACSTGEVLATGAKLKKLFCPGLYENFVDVSYNFADLCCMNRTWTRGVQCHAVPCAVTRAFEPNVSE